MRIGEEGKMPSLTCGAQLPAIGECSRMKPEPGAQRLYLGGVGIEIAHLLVLLSGRNIGGRVTVQSSATSDRDAVGLLLVTF